MRNACWPFWNPVQGYQREKKIKMEHRVQDEPSGSRSIIARHMGPEYVWCSQESAMFSTVRVTESE